MEQWIQEDNKCLETAKKMLGSRDYFRYNYTGSSVAVYIDLVPVIISPFEAKSNLHCCSKRALQKKLFATPKNGRFGKYSKG